MFLPLCYGLVVPRRKRFGRRSHGRPRKITFRLTSRRLGSSFETHVPRQVRRQRQIITQLVVGVVVAALAVSVAVIRYPGIIPGAQDLLEQARCTGSGNSSLDCENQCGRRGVLEQ